MADLVCTQQLDLLQDSPWSSAGSCRHHISQSSPPIYSTEPPERWDSYCQNRADVGTSSPWVPEMQYWWILPPKSSRRDYVMYQQKLLGPSHRCIHGSILCNPSLSIGSVGTHLNLASPAAPWPEYGSYFDRIRLPARDRHSPRQTATTMGRTGSLCWTADLARRLP